MIFYHVHIRCIMIIQYKFKYIHSNGLLIRLLNKIAKESNTEIFLDKEEDNYLLESSGEQNDLEKLATFVSTTIPSSIFLKHSSVQEIKEFAATKKSLEDNTKFYSVPFCIECQDKIFKNSKDLNLDCEICGFSNVGLDAEDIEEKALEFEKNGECEVQTFNGKRLFSKTESSSIICNDYANISEYFVITQSELNAMTSVEKPAIRLKPKLKFKLEFDLNKPFYYVFLPDDKITLSFCSFNKETKIIFCDDINIPKVATALDKVLIIDSARDFQDNNINNEIDMLQSIISEHKLITPSICAIHLSHKSNSKIFTFNSKIGHTSVVEFTNLPDSLSEVFELIKNQDESGEKLINNFQLKFEKLYSEIITHIFINKELQALSRFFAIVSNILNIGISHLDLESTAIEFGGKSGPRIDYKIKSEDGKYILDLTKAVRSVISFKLAGVDEYLISFGVLDSLADFLATQAESAEANASSNTIFLSGNIFENRQLLLRTINAIEPNYKIYTNERTAIWS